MQESLSQKPTSTYTVVLIPRNAMQRFLVPLVFVLGLGLAACNFGSSTPSDTASSSSSSSEDSGDLVTHNVSYTGTIDELGMTTYQQGTHKLILENGQFLILESTDANLNLNTYLGKSVEIRGSLQPTVEAGGMLLRAEEVIVLGVTSSSSSSSETVSSESRTMCGGIAGLPCESGQECVDDPSDGCDPRNGGADCSGMCVTVMKESSSSEAMKSSVMSSAVRSSVMQASSKSSVVSSAASSSQSSVAGNSAAIEQQNVLLAKQTYDQDSLWTQKYCTSHIAFCVPVHKNWYFKSFGATTSNLWHVELGMSDIAELGDGAIILNLVSGSSASMQAQSGQIKTQGSDVIGFMDWQDGTHFEIIADARVKAAVSYMLAHITAYAGAQ